MKTRAKVLIGAIAIMFASSVYAAVTCPIDNFDMYFTGKSKTEMGKLLYQYKCASGHITWFVQ
jgi:hypothetical protein